MLQAPVTYTPARAHSPAQAPATAPRIHFQPIAANGFFATLRARVDEHFKATNASPTGGVYIATKAALYFGLAAACYTLLLTGGFSETMTLALAVAYGVATILLGVNVGHDGAFGHDFATHALITSLDWNPQSPLTQFVAGGANAHAAHHLFPHMSHAHYAAVSRLVERTAREYGIRYNRTTFLGLVASHFRFLHKMGTG